MDCVLVTIMMKRCVLTFPLTRSNITRVCLDSVAAVQLTAAAALIIAVLEVRTAAVFVAAIVVDVSRLHVTQAEIS